MARVVASAPQYMSQIEIFGVTLLIQYNTAVKNVRESMQIKKLSSVGCSIVITVILMDAPSAFGQSASFQRVGDIPGGEYESDCRGVSGDGRIVVGNSQASTGIQGFEWEGGTMSPIGVLQGGTFTAAYAISRSGQVVAGTADQNGATYATRWVLGFPFMLFPPEGSSISRTQGWGISPDGLVVVGDLFRQNPTDRTFAGRWDGSTPLELPGDSISVAFDASQDGQVVVGYSEGSRAVAWINDSLAMLPLVPGGRSHPYQATAVTPDGQVIVGLTSGEQSQAFRWEGGVVVLLGLMPGDDASHAYDVSSSGNVIVGAGTVGSTGLSRATIWDPVHGLRNLQAAVQGDFGLDTSGWTLEKARAVSESGTTIVGQGINPAGRREGWVITLRDNDSIPSTNDNCPLARNKNQLDSDADGVGNACDGCPLDPQKVLAAVCGCGIPDTDSDGDGSPDCMDNCPSLENPTQADCDDDGIGDACQLFKPGSTDCNNNGVPDECELRDEPDCNSNNLPDDCDIMDGGPDCNSNGVPDECELFENDCNTTLVPDECELKGHDCNANSIPDGCELSGNDCNLTLVPDECELTDNDCNANSIPDDCELSAGDCNTNRVPDVCELLANDCNLTLVPDECELADNDCNVNSIPDDCELIGADCNKNGIPDECEADCNNNGLADDCDLANGSSLDCDRDNFPDDCEPDEDGDGFIDDCDSCVGTPPGLVLDESGCPVPIGPCCFDTNICVDKTVVADCGLVSGTYLGDGLRCDSDPDGDGSMGCEDGCPNDPAKFLPGVCGCGASDADADADSVPDCIDLCLRTQGKVPVNSCGCESAGACCFAVGVCFNSTAPEECDGIEGFYQGDGTLCDEGCDFGDSDGNGTVDLLDVARLQTCFNGASGKPIDESCNLLDLERCGQIELRDATAILRALSGPR
jgi:uncharacterized membrane protein